MHYPHSRIRLKYLQHFLTNFHYLYCILSRNIFTQYFNNIRYFSLKKVDCKRDKAVCFHAHSQLFSTTILDYIHEQIHSACKNNLLFHTNSSPSFAIYRNNSLFFLLVFFASFTFLPYANFDSLIFVWFLYSYHILTGAIIRMITSWPATFRGQGTDDIASFKDFAKDAMMPWCPWQDLQHLLKVILLMVQKSQTTTWYV